MSKIAYRPLAIALAYAFASHVWAQTTDVPLDVIRQDYGNGQYGYRLGINVGVNGAAPKEYLFDTGSDSFNIDVGLGALQGSSPDWFPNEAGASTGPLQFYLYGDGSYGYLQSSTTVSSMQFYNSGSGTRVGSFGTAAGAPVAVNYAWVSSTATGDPVGTVGNVTLKIDTDFQKNLADGKAPEEGAFYGTFGAGDFGNGVPGMLTKSGYIVEANGGAGVPGQCGQGCMILGLTPALRAQFLSVVSWSGGAQGQFALSGAPSASQFDTQFVYALSDGRHTSTAVLPTLFDTGTPNIMLIDNGVGLVAGETAAGHLNPYGDENPGITLTVTGAAHGALPASITTGNDASGDYSNVVTLGPYGGFPSSAIYGISFFMHNAVMYDLANQSTGYTPFYVTDAPITAAFTATAAMGPLGLAGTISGSGAFTVAGGGVANLSGSNTYTGATLVERGGWLGLAGPGSIAQSSGAQVDGALDISRTAQATELASLSGGGEVLLGSNVLMLTGASGNFTGRLADGGLSGTGGGALVVAGGRQQLSGSNTYTGTTGVAARGELLLTGSLASGVLNLGVLDNQGRIGGSVVNQGLLNDSGDIGGGLDSSGILAGQGRIGGDLLASAGGIAPDGRGLLGAGDYRQSAGATLRVQPLASQPDAAAGIAVDGSAYLAAGALLGAAPSVPGRFYQAGARYTVLSAGRGVQGRYTLAGNGAVSAVLGVAPAYDADHVYLDVVQQRSLASIDGTRNQRAVLGGLQTLAVANPVFTAVANQPTDAAIRNAGDALSGDIHPSFRGTLLDDSRFIRDAADSRLVQASGDDLAAGPATGTPGSHGFTAWGQVLGAWGHRAGDGNAAGAARSLGGAMVGGDLPVGEASRIGAMAGYTRTSLRVPSRAGTDRSDDTHLGFYAGQQRGDWRLRGGLAFSWHRFDAARTVAFTGLSERLFAHGRATTSQAFAEVGRRVSWHGVALEPFARAAYVRLASPAFAERGGASALAVQGQDDVVAYGTLGARAGTRFAFRHSVLDAHVQLGWRHGFGRMRPDAAVAFEGSSSFVVDGVPMARDAMVLDADLALPLSRSTTLTLAYDGLLGHRSVDGAVRGGIVWRL
ncbi:hypothetical protein ATSB10_33870 [Dyella thiooxydans]|uniref:Autotransporter domain-containing protein n=1 Tax=Dyella thiooxydans TaxID=445710 RepID=A0A160N488_9GAMM|nr:autotransporter domain-containing protein [Dyella thiooxydans]AND70841.1 hypothetical protein ATSB10_33870 [Dyella thiooxydans]